MFRIVIVVVCLTVMGASSAAASPLSMGLHNQFQAKRAAKGYQVPSRYRWWSRSFRDSRYRAVRYR